jgi:hypothetical protein
MMVGREEVNEDGCTLYIVLDCIGEGFRAGRLFQGSQGKFCQLIKGSMTSCLAQ